MAIEIIPVRNSKQLKHFLKFEWQINKDVKNWISPLYMERKKLLDTKRNPFFEHAEIEFFLAYKDEKLCGRIAAITNQNYNDFQGNKAGMWGFFECINDQEAANALFKAAADWLKSKGKDEMIGPMNPSTNDECGMLIDGFDTPPFLMMTHTLPYYPKLTEGFGNKKAKDLYAWLLTTETAIKSIPEKMVRVSEKILDKYNIQIRNIRIKDIKNEIKLIKEVYNDAWSRNWGFVPFTDVEIDKLAADLKTIADERMIFIAEKAGKPVGFCVSLPNLNEIMVKIPNGRLLPTGIFKLLFGLKKIKQVRVIILGVIKEIQSLGLSSVFFINTILNAKKYGYTGGELSWILEDNHAMNKVIEIVGSNIYKTYRIYTYPLN
ncbi:MAG: hypothetical protein JXR46_08850 [Calditrichaceae bacterium]|nr:hypothetical protein [Calditrichaceae bacterium]